MIEMDGERKSENSELSTRPDDVDENECNNVTGIRTR